MGILLAAAIVEKVSGEPMPEFVARTIFNPLSMRQTSFGLGGRPIADTAQCQVPEADRSDWDWNSAYSIQTGSLRPSFGLGWQREPGTFGRTCSTETFGHFGSTGTMAWHDPATAITCVLLTTKPAAVSRSRLLLPVSELIGRTSA